jgi:hypothetical protein
MMRRSLKQYEKDFFAPVREDIHERVLNRMSDICGLDVETCRLVRDNFLETWLLFLSNPQLINKNGIDLKGIMKMTPLPEKMKRRLHSLNKPSNYKKRARFGKNYESYFKQLNQFYVQAKSKRRVYDYAGNGTVDPKNTKRIVIAGNSNDWIWKFDGV